MQYCCLMPQTLEKRVEELERKSTELAQQSGRAKKNWQKTFGFSRDDVGFDDLVRRGREYRRGIN